MVGPQNISTFSGEETSVPTSQLLCWTLVFVATQRIIVGSVSTSSEIKKIFGMESYKINSSVGPKSELTETKKAEQSILGKQILIQP